MSQTIHRQYHQVAVQRKEVSVILLLGSICPCFEYSLDRRFVHVSRIDSIGSELGKRLGIPDPVGQSVYAVNVYWRASTSEGSRHGAVMLLDRDCAVWPDVTVAIPIRLKSTCSAPLIIASISSRNSL